MKSRLFSRNYSLVVIGQVISILGSAILRFALNLYVLDLTGRADIFGLLIAVSAIPAILFTPLGGVVADRLNRRNLMVIFDFSSSAVILLFILLTRMENASIIVVGAVLAMLSMISAMYQPVVQASIPLLVERELLTSANGIVMGVAALSGLMGPVLGGVLYGMIGLNALVVAGCVAFFLSAVMEIFIQIPFTKPLSDKNIIPTIVDDMKLGIRYVVKERPTILKIIIIAAAFNSLMSPFFHVGTPYILRITLQSSETMYGIGMGVGELSTILGAVLAGVITKRLTLSTTHKLLFIVSAVMPFVVLSVTPMILNLGYWQPFVLLISSSAITMALLTTASIFVLTSIQKETPNAMLGKVMGILMAVSQSAVPLGMALYGLAFEVFSNAIYVPASCACLITALIAFAAKRMLKNAEI